MKPSSRLRPGLSTEAASFLACLASILEMTPEQLPALAGDEDPISGWSVSRWLGGLGMGLAPVADAASFSWAGPWIARVRPPDSEPASGPARFVVMFGIPSGVIWDPAGEGSPVLNHWISDGYLPAAADISLARPPLLAAPTASGTVEQIWIAPSAGEPARALSDVRALAGLGLEGDRHVLGTGTFPSGLPGSALTLIEVEVCVSFEPPLGPDEHRRNVLTRGIALNQLVGHEFTIGVVRCRGMRLCEPCTVTQRYAGRPVLRELVHRGGLRADILVSGALHVGDEVRAVDAETAA